MAIGHNLKPKKMKSKIVISTKQRNKLLVKNIRKAGMVDKDTYYLVDIDLVNKYGVHYKQYTDHGYVAKNLSVLKKHFEKAYPKRLINALMNDY